MLERLKEEVVYFSRLMQKYGLSGYASGNLSAKDSETGLVVITPSGIPYERLTADDLVIMDSEGVVVKGGKKPSSEFLLHLLTYEKRPEVKGIVHFHSSFASAFASLGKEIPAVLAEVAFSVKAATVKVAPYARPGSLSVAEKTVDALGKAYAVLLANHGALACGTSIEEAFSVASDLEEIARVYHLALSIGQPNILSEVEIENILLGREEE